MRNDDTATPDADVSLHVLQPMLENLVDRVPGVLYAVLASRDGLVKPWAGLEAADAERYSAALAGLQALAEFVFPDADGLGLHSIEHLRGTFVMVHCRNGASPQTAGALLAVMAAPEADLGVVGFEITSWIGSLDEHLTTQLRKAQADED
ncbi:roadblock/LC7 domain-containing protein [Streptomyces spectabilis]|uniref:Putative regulator of Ras-like GTPase activity (Roadblock/LC7/MglB family) n=1 Tax=Streptomyces spectabilis TaxID=68270 RepID=A0A7W8B296_STRST|nr:roadblock/LC7 domain-containing protein [Streptomyces spectabilis]MBB5108993.1 putative regulator of Ras-like GTPase activity (Roadblock/LC7/MglB family) [Streptomyces spectabilis]GGV50553.1 hypothetical protein GCM10010245_79670 [Streptomyces spectabilis]